MAQFYIKKIKRDGFSLVLDYTELKDRYLNTHKSKFYEMARAEFYDTFGRLVHGFCLGLKFVFMEEEVLARFRPVGVTYGQDKEEREYAVIVCDYIIPDTLSKVTLKSPPYYLAETQEESKFAGCWDVDTSRLLMKLREEAQLFLMGERAQGRLFGTPVEVPEMEEAIPFAGDAAQIGDNVVPMRG